jgi:hypothetical protein
MISIYSLALLSLLHAALLILLGMFTALGTWMFCALTVMPFIG